MKNKTEHLSSVDHGYIRYANVWEDPILLLEGLTPKGSDKILSIASAGDNAFALLRSNPSLVVAVDLNKTQLYLTELKTVAIKALNQNEYIEFVGFNLNDKRIKTYDLIKSNLNSEAKAYWDNKQEIIEKGIIYQGKFENYLATFAKRLLPLIHSKKKISTLFEEKSADQQKEFFEQKWNSFRWKAFFNIFFSKRVMGIFGRDPAFLEQVESNVAKSIKASADIHLSSIYSQNNPFLYYCLKGDFGDYLPFYAQKENYNSIKNNIDLLKLELGYAQDVGEKYGNFDAFNLSNIFEYMNNEVFKFTAESLKNIANNEARFSYWNLLVKREISAIDKNFSRIHDEMNWKERDQGFFYMQFVTEKFLT